MSGESENHDAVTADWAAAILDFWFGQVGEQGWWSHDPALDQSCRRFEPLWREEQALPAETFLNRADDALAAVILFDQLPRNMFRGEADAFVTDPLAREIARGAVARGYDVQIGGAGRRFFYMPLMHSEAMDDQELSLTLFKGEGDAQSLDFARKHHAVIARHGRFPGRNAALGRATRPEEEAAIAETADW